MPSLIASKVAAASDILHTHINNIIEDIRNNHDHKDGRGYPVDHADLLESDAMDSVAHTHEDIETHMMGTGGSFIDNPGGDEGVHGLISGQHVVGTLANGNLIIDAGVKASPGTSGSITLSDTYTSVLAVHLTPQHSADCRAWITSRTTSTVNYGCSVAPTGGLHWMVLGFKTP